MRQIFLNEKTGFDVIDVRKPIIIRDARGIMFYSTEPLLPNVTSFNLPPTFRLFVESGHFRPRRNPVNFKIIKIGKKDRFKKKNPLNFKIIFAFNPNKITVDWNMNIIVFDNSFKEKPIYEIYYGLFHEAGHKFWDKGESAEKKCDEYAINEMLKFGFNPIQCRSGINGSLTGNTSKNRKENIFQKTLKNER